MTKAAELAKMGEVLTNGQIGGRRNIVINGAMQVAQRGTSFTGVTSTGTYHIDRFQTNSGDSSSQFTVTQATAGLNGFANSAKFDCTTAQSSLGTDSRVYFEHKLEGQDLQQLKKGTSDAEKVTISFYVKSTKTGTYIVELQDYDNSRQISQAYTISSSGTWEQKILTFDADTTGAFDDDNAHSLSITWWLVAGSRYSGGTLSTSWTSITDANKAAGQVNLADSTDNTWEITGVQLEVGSQATPFEHRSFGEELMLCQRYFSHSGDPTNNGFVHHMYLATNSYGNFSFAVPMRTSPSVTIASTSNSYFYSAGANKSASSYLAQNISEKNFQHKIVHGSGTAGYAGHLDTDSGTRFYQADAEL